jgi:methionyl-tRNA formyltransferase
MRVLFYGTPAFAVPSLEALITHHTVVAAVTQPDRPAHRGQRLTASPVKERALAAGIPVLQPAQLRDPEWPDRLGAYAPEVAVVVAFGQILPRAVLDVAPRGSINVHASLLPRYRGAAPIAWAIIRARRRRREHHAHGRGPGHGAEPWRADADRRETAGELAVRLADLGAGALVQTLARLDTLAPVDQPHAEATLAPRLKKDDGRLDWSRPRAAGEPRARVQSMARRPDARASGRS